MYGRRNNQPVRRNNRGGSFCEKCPRGMDTDAPRIPLHEIMYAHVCQLNGIQRVRYKDENNGIARWKRKGMTISAQGSALLSIKRRLFRIPLFEKSASQFKNKWIEGGETNFYIELLRWYSIELIPLSFDPVFWQRFSSIPTCKSADSKARRGACL